MALKVEDRIARLDPERRRRVEKRAADLIAEEMTLRELRKARQLTQARVATELSITQDGVSRLNNAATCCFPRCARRSRQWAEAFR